MSLPPQFQISITFQRRKKATNRLLASSAGLIDILNVIGVDKDTIRDALKTGLKDFEDSIQISAARFNKLDCIITRNSRDFEKADISIFTPDDYLYRFR